ncbi:unnamed protein product [Sphagnum jensenii]|uniref:Uncharacterized protein n=1 Tax=Sphagnum jensenii TaxID=128206 RepID=A0ABP1BPP5_9BRYO
MPCLTSLSQLGPPIVSRRTEFAKTDQNQNEIEGLDTGSKAASAKAAPAQDGMEEIAAVTVEIAGSLGKSEWIRLVTNAVNLIRLVNKQMGIFANTSDPEIREVVKSSLKRCNRKTLELVDFLTRCKGNLRNIFEKFRAAGHAAEKHPNDIETIKKLTAEARGVQEGSQTTISVTQDIDPSRPNALAKILSDMEKEIKSTMEEYKRLLSESQLAIKNLSKKKAVTTSRVGKCVGVAAAGLTVAVCATAYAVHPTIGSCVATAAGIGVAKAGAAGIGVAKAGAAGIGVAKAGAAAGVAKAGAAAGVAKAGAAAGVAKAGAAAGVAKVGTAAGVAKVGTAAGVAKAGVAVACLSISWAEDMQAAIGHLDTALRALNNINTTADKIDVELNWTKSSLYNLETAIQLAGERLDDLSRSSKKPQGLRANLIKIYNDG